MCIVRTYSFPYFKHILHIRIFLLYINIYLDVLYSVLYIVDTHLHIYNIGIYGNIYGYTYMYFVFCTYSCCLGPCAREGLSGSDGSLPNFTTCSLFPAKF
jgi:hypothetical protein